MHQRAWRPRSANWTDFQCLLISSYDQSNRCPGKPYSSHSAFRSRFCVRCRDTTRMVFAASNISTLNFGARGALKTTHVETVVSLLVTDTGQPPGTGFSEAETGPQNGAPCIRRDRVTEIVMKKARQRRAKLATLHELKENQTGWWAHQGSNLGPADALGSCSNIRFGRFDFISEEPLLRRRKPERRSDCLRGCSALP